MFHVIGRPVSVPPLSDLRGWKGSSSPRDKERTCSERQAEEIVMAGSASWPCVDLARSWDSAWMVRGTILIDNRWQDCDVREWSQDVWKFGFDRLDPVRWYLPCAQGLVKAAGDVYLEAKTDRSSALREILRTGKILSWLASSKHVFLCVFHAEHFTEIAKIMGPKLRKTHERSDYRSHSARGERTQRALDGILRPDGY